MAINGAIARIPLAVKILVPGVIAIFLVVALSPKPKPFSPEPDTLPVVFVVQAKMLSASVDVMTQGTVEPKREIDVVAQVAGQIVDVGDKFVGGEFFHAGQALVKIDPRDYEFALVKAKSQLANAEQALALERGRVRQAKREWRDLGNEDANQLFLRQPQLAASYAQLAAAKADVSSAELNLERTNISVPFSGRIRTAHVDLGQYIMPGTPIARVYDTRIAEVRLPLTDRQLALVNLPLAGESASKMTENHFPEVEISAKMGGERYQWEGVIKRTEASIDTRSRMYYAIVEIQNPFASEGHNTKPSLMVGLFVDAKIKGKQLENIIELPSSSVFRRNRVFTLDSENKISEVEVNVVKRNKHTSWVQGNIELGSRVVLNNQNFLSPGTLVKPSPIGDSEIKENLTVSAEKRDDAGEEQ